MKSELANNIVTFASGRCPHCEGAIEGAQCTGCGQEFEITPPTGGDANGD